MDPGTIFNVVQTLISMVDSRTLRDYASGLGVEKKINKLQRILSAINAVRLDADERGVLLHIERDWLKKLQEVVYDAEDVLDAFNTLSQQQQICNPNKFLKTVRCFFPSCKVLRMSHKIDDVMKRLDDIAKERQNYAYTGYTITREQIMPIRRRDTQSFVNDKDVVGRDDDKKAVIDMLLDSNNPTEENLSCVSVVGIGGLGKTTLAQLIFNDERAKSEFTTKLWVCVSEDFDLESLMKRIIISATNKKPEDLGRDQLHMQLQKEIDGKRILLVLDDVWNENRNRWLEFKGLLVGVGSGSRILVTTRSKKVAKVMGDYPMYELQGLSPEHSWCLFEKMAFGSGQEQLRGDAELLEIGKEIIKKCVNVPLAIRMIGSLLYGQDKCKWVSFKNNELAAIEQEDGDILPTLKRSYYHLPGTLKRCFAYCAIFPEDYDIEKDLLINLWMAEGFITPLYNEDLEDKGEEYFRILIERCFFQDIKIGEWNEIKSVKIHDLLHNLAITVAENEGILCMEQRPTVNLKKFRHFSRGFAPSESQEIFWSLPIAKKVDVVPTHCNGLRVLDLRGFLLSSLPNSVNKLIHLRYLDLSNNSFENIPKSITKLWNLQTILLRYCTRLKQLPKKFNRLINLRQLDITGCSALQCMPPGLGSLSSLHMLSMFIVSDSNSSSKSCDVGHLQDLKGLQHLKGELAITIRGNLHHLEKSMGADLRSKQHMMGLCIQYPFQSRQCHQRHEALLEDLQPHPNLRLLMVDGYAGKNLPSWLPLNNLESLLPNLVEINLSLCFGLQYLPSLHKLPYLKRLTLMGLTILYMEHKSASSQVSSELTLFFSRLEDLKLVSLPNLMGWWSEVKEAGVLGDEQGEDRSVQSYPFFPRLSNLEIDGCPNLISMPMCPFVGNLRLKKFNDELSIFKEETIDLVTTSNLSMLKNLEIDSANCLISFPEGSLQNLSSLSILVDIEMERLSTFGPSVFQRLASLHSLKISACKKLKTLNAGGLEHLSTLETLTIDCCDKLTLMDEDGDDGILPWKSLGSYLRYLSLHDLPRVENLPKGFQYLSSLQYLTICSVELTALPEWIGGMKCLQHLGIVNCKRLKSMPEAMKDLTSLKQLLITGCPHLTKSCMEPCGEDWPKIRHIPDIYIL